MSNTEKLDNTVTLSIEDYQYYKDCAAILSAFGPPTYQCDGGKIVAQGFVCPHCGSGDPEEECHYKTQSDQNNWAFESSEGGNADT